MVVAGSVYFLMKKKREKNPRLCFKWIMVDYASHIGRSGLAALLIPHCVIMQPSIVSMLSL